MAKIDLSIIIVSYNTKKITEDCLKSINRSLRASKIQYEIVVADNDSKDGSDELLKKMAGDESNHLVYFQTGENLGFGKGNNFAVKKARGKYLFLLNSDTVILNNSIEKLYNFYLKNEANIHFIGPKLLNRDFTPQPSACRFFSIPVIFATLFLRGDYWGLTRFSPMKLQKVDWISGAAILTKKILYEQLRGFDETIFMYMEEVDLLYRASNLGFKTYIYPSAQIVHLGSASSGGRTFPILQVYKGFLFFYKKHYSRLNLTILKLLLKTKAIIALIIGRIKGNKYLIETYEQAYKIS